MKNVALHPVKCAECRVQLVVGLDEKGDSWAYCTQCRSCKPMLDIIVEGLQGQIGPPDNPGN